jgi:hypothetical protein
MRLLTNGGESYPCLSSASGYCFAKLSMRPLWSGRLRGLLPRDSHGAGHADFPHPALRSTVSLRDVCRTNARLRQWVTHQEPKHFLPREPSPLRAAAQPFPPHSDDTEAEANQGVAVSGDTEIRKVPSQLLLKCQPLVANWLMPMLPTPIGDTLESTSKAVRCGFLLHHPMSSARHGPIMGEAQQVERARPDACIALTVGRCYASSVWPLEIDQSGLLRMKHQTVFR